jgi:hypothetical protein
MFSSMTLQANPPAHPGGNQGAIGRDASARPLADRTGPRCSKRMSSSAQASTTGTPRHRIPVHVPNASNSVDHPDSM